MTDDLTLHATCVAWDGRAVLIIGDAGTGKSSLGLELMGYGCALVADDRVALSVADGALLAACPPTIAGLIEARGVGILNADTIATAQVALVVDLNKTVAERLPERRVITLLGCELPLIYHIDGPKFAAKILQTLKAGWSDR